MSVIRFYVLGVPAPQGSKTAVVRGNKAILLDGASAAARSKHAQWRQAVAAAAREAAAGAAPIPYPVAVTIVFRFPMPASRTKKDRALGWLWKPTTPDLDKVLRSTFDGLTDGGIITDDRIIVSVVATKIEVEGWTGASIEIKPAQA